MLSLYCGNGKGKTAFAIGNAMRAAAKDKKVLFVEFVKQEDVTDKKALEVMYSVTVSSAPVSIDLFDDDADNKAQAGKVFRELFDSAVRTVLQNKYDMLILDGVFDVVDKGFIPHSEVYEFVSNAPDSLEIVCTGAKVDDKFITLATYATEVADIKA